MKRIQQTLMQLKILKNNVSFLNQKGLFNLTGNMSELQKQMQLLQLKTGKGFEQSLV